MQIAVAEMKKQLVAQVLDLEKKQIGRVKWKRIQFNTPEYYRCFEALYLSDGDSFVQALLELRDLSDEVYNDFESHVSQISYFCPQRIAVHILWLSLYFDVHTNEIPVALKKLFLLSIDLQSSGDLKVSHGAFGLFQSCCNFFESVANPTSVQPQLCYGKNERPSLVFANFLTLHEVTNISFAILYEMCYRYKCINQCPVYIKDAIKAANLYDRLIGPDAWELYLIKRSAQSVHKDISLFRKVGFERIPDLLSELLLKTESTVFVSKEKKERFIKQLLVKNQSCITQSMNAKECVINDFLLSKTV